MKTKVRIKSLDKEGYIERCEKLTKNTEYYVRYKPRETSGYVGKFIKSTDLEIV